MDGGNISCKGDAASVISVWKNGRAIMRNVATRIILACAATYGFVISSPLAAQQYGYGYYPLYGFTKAVFNGLQGVLGLTQACQKEFPGSRICTSAEVALTQKLPTLPL